MKEVAVVVGSFVVASGIPCWPFHRVSSAWQCFLQPSLLFLGGVHQ